MFNLLAAATATSDLEAAAALNREALLVHGLARALEETAHRLRETTVDHHWWGPARQALQVAIDIERERLHREMLRLDGVVDQLRVDAVVAEGLIGPMPLEAGVQP